MSVHIREKQLSNGRTRLYFDIYNKGNREYLHPDGLILTKDNAGGQNKQVRALAERMRAEIEFQVLNGEYVTDKGKNLSFLDYFAAQRERRPSESTRMIWRSIENHLREYSKEADRGPLTFSMITREWLERWQAHLLRKLSSTTAANYYSTVRTVLRQAAADDLIRKSPCEKVKPLRRRSIQRTYLLVEELERLQATPCRYPEVARAFLFACFTGPRISDLRALRGKDVVGTRIEFRQRKTDELSYVDLGPQALALLGERPIDPEALLFDLPPLKTYNRALKEWAAAAGVNKHLTSHAARHTFATMLLTYGADLYTASKLLGHSSVQTTQVYARIVDSVRLAAVTNLPTLGTPTAVPSDVAAG